MASFREDVRDQIVAIRETFVDGWNDARLFVAETWPALAILLIILGIALWLADPAPPRDVYMATGAPGTSFETMGKKYQAYFEKQGIRLHLVSTEGSVENVRRLQDPNDRVMAAFVMSGTALPHAPRIQTLGSINYQPLWCFYRNPVRLTGKERTDFLLGHEINFGPPGSGTSVLTRKVLELSGLDPESAFFKHMPEAKAIDMLIKKQLTTLCIVDAYESPNVQRLLKVDGLQLTNFRRAEAFSRMVPAIEKVTVPEGGLSLATDRPDQAMTLIAATTEIVIDERLHPAIQTLFLLAATAIDGKQTFFSNEGEFPSFKDTSLYRSHEAEIFYEKGTPLLAQFMPFWLAEFIRRLALALVPFLAVAYPVIRSMPNYHKNRVRGRINRMYGALKFFEQSLVSGYDPEQKTVYLAQLDAMEREALGMKVPKSVSGDYYTLRSSIDFVRNCVLRDGYEVHASAHMPMQAASIDSDDDENDDA